MRMLESVPARARLKRARASSWLRAGEAGPDTGAAGMGAEAIHSINAPAAMANVQIAARLRIRAG